MTIKPISPTDPNLADVIILGKKNSKTLGMFPEGAFKDHAKKNFILGAIEKGKLLGYILFRITQSKQTISITHLCISDEHRNKGIAKALLDALKQKYCYQVQGFNLSCREDFTGPSRFWEKYGFKAMGKTRSRSKVEKYLVKWHYDFGNQNLFTQNVYTPTKINALLDSNIIIKLRDEPCPENAEAQALEADWLDDEVEYYFAPEIYNEINRDINRERANATRRFLSHFTEARFDPNLRDNFFNTLGQILPGPSVNDISDRKQIAECLAAGLEYFITMDSGILGNSDDIFNKYQLKILTPTDFILLIDQLRNAKDYVAYRLAGAHYEYRKIAATDVDDLVNNFVQEGQGERKHILRNLLTSVATDVKSSVLRLVKDPNDRYIGFFAATYEQQKLIVKAIRTIIGKISDILFQQLLYDICSLALNNNKPIISVQESQITPEKALILQSFEFEQHNNEWIKLTLPGQQTINHVLDSCTIVSENWPTVILKERLNSLQGNDLEYFKFRLERKLWPLKLIDIDIPTYIIPIKPHWAAQLFDHRAADQSLFGAKPELSWSKENIYYRSVKPVSEQSPGRILWYVSNDPVGATDRHRGIVACSYLDEICIGPAKFLFQKFKNFGIYEWKHIYELAGQNAFKEIKALRFSDTEVFKKVISYNTICTVMAKNGRSPNTFASPVQVSNGIFNDIYKLSQE